MAVFDAHKNLGVSTVATAPSPALSGTSLVVAAGDGAKFPAVPFNATVWPVGVAPIGSNAEIVRVTAIATDTLTITRSTTTESPAVGPRTILVGDQIAATITAKTLTDIEAMAAGTSTITTTGTQTALALPAGSGPLVIFVNNATLLTLQGVAAGLDGQKLTIVSIGAGQVDIANQNAGASAANRVINLFAATVSLAAGAGRMELIYDLTATRWRVLTHDQGDYIDYSATSTIVGWSSFVTNRKNVFYKVVGRIVILAIHLEGTSNATTVTFTIPFASVAGPTGVGYPGYSGNCGFIYDNSGYPTVTARVQQATTSSQFEIVLGPSVSSGGWTASGTKIVDCVLTYFV